MYNDNPFWKFKNMLEARGHYDGMGGYVGGYSSGRIGGPSTDPPEDRDEQAHEYLQNELEHYRNEEAKPLRQQITSAVEKARKAGVEVPEDYHKGLLSAKTRAELPKQPEHWKSIWSAGESHPHHEHLAPISDAHDDLEGVLDPNSVPRKAPREYHELGKRLFNKYYST